MSLPPLNPRDPAAMAAARRRAHIAIRSARLRTLGTAGAITTLGVFTGLAAAHSPASPKPAAIAPPVADTAVPASELATPSDDGFVPDDQGGFDEGSAAGQAASDFFAQQSESQSQSGAAPVQSNRTVNPAPAPQYYVAPPRPAAPPAAMSSTS